MKIARFSISLAIAFCAVAVVIGLYFGSRSLRAPSAQPIAGLVTRSVVIPAKGMACMACAAKTKQALRSVAGVVEVEPGSATGRYEPVKVQEQGLKEAVQRAGFTAVEA